MDHKHWMNCIVGQIAGVKYSESSFSACCHKTHINLQAEKLIHNEKNKETQWRKIFNAQTDGKCSYKGTR